MNRLWRHLRAAGRILVKRKGFDVRLCEAMAVNQGRFETLVHWSAAHPEDPRMIRVLLRSERHLRRLAKVARQHGHNLW